MKRNCFIELLFPFAIILVLSFGLYLGGPYWNIIDNIQEGDFSSDTTSANYVLFSVAPQGISSSEIYSYALLVSDQDEINKIFRLVNKGISWSPCFDNIFIGFWENSYALELFVTVDEDCSRYNWRLKSYFHDLKKHPTHYIYNIRISEQTPPNKVVEDFENEQLDIFLMKGPNPNLPSIDITMYWFPENVEEWSIQKEDEGIKYFQSKLDKLTEIYTIVSIDEIRCGYIFKKGEHGCRLEANLKFEITTDLSEIEKLSEQLGLEVSNKKDNDYYFLQLVIEDSDLSNVQKTIMSKFDYVIDVFRFPAMD